MAPGSRTLAVLLFPLLLAATGHPVAAALPHWDLRSADGARGWMPLHDCRWTSPDPTWGLTVEITGEDPYLAGPPFSPEPVQPLWLELELRSETGGSAQVFYFDQLGPSEDRSVRFAVPAGSWFTARVPLPALGPGSRFRFDPPGSRGRCDLRSVRLSPRPLLQGPAWPKPVPPQLPSASPSLTSGELALQFGSRWGEWRVQVAGQDVAIGPSRALVGYQTPEATRWFALDGEALVRTEAGGVLVSCQRTDPDGGHWTFHQAFRPSPRPGGIDIESRVEVDRERRVVSLPMVSVFPGAGSFGTRKSQALFAGVEYLADEPSSSERDLIGPQARRQVPDTLKLTFPLMSVAAGGRWLALTWEPSRLFSALFDSPDRVFHSGGSVFSLQFPGSDPALREEGALLPYAGEWLKAGDPLVLRATLLGGRGDTVVPAVQEYVARRGLPPLPDPGRSATAFFRLQARAWLDTAIRSGSRYRHAVGPGFGAQPAADVAFNMDWLARQVDEPALADRLTRAAAEALAEVPPEDRMGRQIGHLRLPLAPLVYGAVEENLATALEEGRRLVARFQPDGSFPYAPPASGPDYARTQDSREAGGLAATAVYRVLQIAAFCGDAGLLRDALRLLRGLDRFREQVPRGAQSWEIPLHTPDILASAALAHAYVLGYELTGTPDFLEQARYWAWTGVPFVYLAPRPDLFVGPYCTTPVLGATQWIAPNWIGLPVQWCGLVYADALLRLAPHDPSGPWVTLAHGIARSGIQQVHPESEPSLQGLLPDSFNLATQSRNPVPINPATLLPVAVRALGFPDLYDFHSLTRSGIRIHAPGPVEVVEEAVDRVRFRVAGWPRSRYRTLVNGLVVEPRVRIEGADSPPVSAVRFQPQHGVLVLELEGSPVVTLDLTAAKSLGKPGPGH